MITKMDEQIIQNKQLRFILCKTNASCKGNEVTKKQEANWP